MLAKCLCKLKKNTIMKFWHVIMAPIRCHIFEHIAKCIDDILFAFSFFTKLNTLTWAFGSTFFFEIRILKSYLVWPHKMAIYVIINSPIYDRWFLIPSFWIFCICTFVPLVAFEFIDGRSMVLWTWIVIIGLVNTICGVPKTLVFAIGSSKLLFKFLLIENLPNPRPRSTAYLITTPFLATFMLNTTTMSIHVVAITVLSDWVTSILVGCLWVWTTTVFNTFGEVVLTLVQWCSNQWLSIGILCHGKCGCDLWFSAPNMNRWTNLLTL